MTAKAYKQFVVPVIKKYQKFTQLLSVHLIFLLKSIFPEDEKPGANYQNAFDNHTSPLTPGQ